MVLNGECQMKIFQVVPFFTPSCGGSVTSTYNLSKELAKLGHEVTIITTDFKFDKEYVKSIEKEGVTLIPFHCVANIGFFLISPSIKKWLIKNIKNFNIIHMHNFRSYQNNVVYRYAKKYNIPYLLQAHGSVLPFFEKQRLKKVYDLIWGYNILKNTSKVIALTRTEVEQYKKMGISEDKIVIIPNGVDLSLFDHLPEKGSFRDKYDITSDTKIVLYLGRLHKIKGIDLLIDAFSEVQKEVPVSKLVIVGPDEGYLQTLQKQVEALNVGRDILFTGPLYGKDKFAAYVDANVYVLPSVYEAFPNTVLEAWACGTPVIVTDCCGIADIIDNQAGLVIPLDKVRLKEALLHMLSDSKTRHQFREKGHSLVMEKFALSKATKQIETIYTSIVGKRETSDK